MSIAKYGTPEWKPISETWKASITTKYEVVCYNCDGRLVLISTNDLEQAKRVAAEHDFKHEKHMAACCMYSGQVVCKCGNVLV